MNVAEFNLNDYILVKLNKQGYARLLDEKNRYLPSYLKCNREDFEIDEEGYMRFQAWDFMATFGSTVSMGSPLLFETTIRIESRFLKEKQAEKI